ncbi:MAG: DnaJ domain-containing protein [Alphaproteobacteria bacterium]|nr:DnaJ domain-containing protein [Alphaproteobacteria bacterium]
MAQYSIDLAYAYAQLGLAEGASLDEIREVLALAVAYRFSTAERVEHIRQLVEFFLARAQLGGLDASFAEIKKAYRQKAMALHPDRNWGDAASGEQLKGINAAYALVDAVHRQAKAYYRQNEDARRDSELQARKATQRERPAGKEKKYTQAASQTTRPAEAERAKEKTKSRSRSASSKIYMAASIPRSIRAARLGYLPLQAIIGCRFIKKENDLNLVFDIVMLPEDQFLRAKFYLSVPDMMGADLHSGRFMPPYILRDIKEIIVPADEADPEKYAKAYFKKEFRL